MAVSANTLLPGDVVQYRDNGSHQFGTVNAVVSNYDGWAELHITDEASGKALKVRVPSRRLMTVREGAE